MTYQYTRDAIANANLGWYNPNEMAMFSQGQGQAGMGDYSDIMGGAIGRPSVVNGMMNPAGPFTGGNSYGNLTGQMGFNMPGTTGPALGMGGPVMGGGGPSFMDGMLGYRSKDGSASAGWGGLALGAAQGLFNGWMGMKQYGLAKDQFKFQKQAYGENLKNQKQTLNTELEDRQRSRVASNSSAYQSVGDYMNKNGLK